MRVLKRSRAECVAEADVRLLKADVPACVAARAPRTQAIHAHVHTHVRATIARYAGRPPAGDMTRATALVMAGAPPEADGREKTR